MLRQNAKSYPGCWVSGWVTGPVSWSYRFSFCGRGVRYIGVGKCIEFEPINICRVFFFSLVPPLKVLSTKKGNLGLYKTRNCDFKVPTFCSSVVWLTGRHLVGLTFIYIYLPALIFPQKLLAAEQRLWYFRRTEPVELWCCCCCCWCCWVLLLLSAAAADADADAAECCCWVLLLLLSTTAAASTFNSFSSPPPAF